MSQVRSNRRVTFQDGQAVKGMQTQSRRKRWCCSVRRETRALQPKRTPPPCMDGGGLRVMEACAKTRKRCRFATLQIVVRQTGKSARAT
jgi:hypothetical protein